jgi:hypothetical protein
MLGFDDSSEDMLVVLVLLDEKEVVVEASDG